MCSTLNNLTNIRIAKSQEDDSPIPHSLFVRDEWESDCAQRFKGMAWVRDKDAKGKVLGSYLEPFTSPDGLNWNKLADASRIPCEDTKAIAFDSLRNRYIATVKGLHGYGVKRYGVPELGRIVYLSASSDFVSWSEPELIFWGDETDREQGVKRIEEALRDKERRIPLTVIPEQFNTDIYWMPIFVYEDLYLALPVLFNQSGRYFTASGSSNQDGFLYPTLVASRDLRNWNRLNRAQFISFSSLSHPTLFDFGMIQACPPVVSGDELRFYYTGYRYTHVAPERLAEAGLAADPNEPRHAIFLARLRKDGFASLDAGSEPGILLTKPVKITGSRLVVNADTRKGELRVELRDAASGRAIPGYGMGDYDGSRVLWSENGKRGAPRIGPGARFEDDPEVDDTVPICGEDGCAITVKWKGGADLSSLKGREVRVFFYLRNASLFAFAFES